METIEILAFARKDLGRTAANVLRRQGYVPGVLYGNKMSAAHFYAHGFSLQPLIRTRQAYFVDLNIEGDTYRCVLQDVQYHPVSEALLHIDFLKLGKRSIEMNIPVVPQGMPIGVTQGGKLLLRLRKLRVKALPQHMPESIPLSVAELALGSSLKVGDIAREGFEILDSDSLPVASVQIPRALRSAADEAQPEEPEAAETTPAPSSEA